MNIKFNLIEEVLSSVLKLEKIIITIKLPINEIQKNILIQEQIFKAISSGVSIDSPSFYTGYVIPYEVQLHEEFSRRIEPYISSNIFDSKANFKIFITHGLTIYNEVVCEIATNVKKKISIFKESGLSEITDDIFN